MSKKILIINIFGIGDVLFTTPLISAIKAQDPDCFLGFVCNQRTAHFVAANPKIDKFYIYNRDEFNALGRTSFFRFMGAMREKVLEIRKEKFDAVFDLSLQGGLSFLTVLAGIPK